MTAHGEALAEAIAHRDVDRDVDRIADLEHIIRRQAEQIARATALLDLWRRRAAETSLDSDWFPPLHREHAAGKAEGVNGCIADLTAALRGDTHDHLPGQRSET